MAFSSIDAEKLNSLIEINTLINTSYSDKNALLIYILESAMRLVKCESSSLLLVNKADNTLHFEVALGPKGPEAKSIPVSRGSIAGWVYEHKQSLIINDVPNDPRFYSGVQEKTGYVTKNMIAVPMLVKNNCIGVIELLNKAESLDFTEEDLGTIEILGNQASIAYQNAETYNVARNEITVLQNAISSGSEFHTFISKSPVLEDLLDVVDQIARTNSSVSRMAASVGKL